MSYAEQQSSSHEDYSPPEKLNLVEQRRLVGLHNRHQFIPRVDVIEQYAKQQFHERNSNPHFATSTHSSYGGMYADDEKLRHLLPVIDWKSRELTVDPREVDERKLKKAGLKLLPQFQIGNMAKPVPRPRKNDTIRSDLGIWRG